MELIVGEKQGRKSRLLLFNLKAPISFFRCCFSTNNLFTKHIFCHANHSEQILYKFIHERLQVLSKTVISFKWFISEMDFPSLVTTEKRNNSQKNFSSTRSQSAQNGSNSHHFLPLCQHYEFLSITTNCIPRHYEAAFPHRCLVKTVWM